MNWMETKTLLQGDVLRKAYVWRPEYGSGSEKESDSMRDLAEAIDKLNEHCLTLPGEA